MPSPDGPDVRLGSPGPKSMSRNDDGRLSHAMFVGNEVLLDIGFPAAQARLAGLARGGSLLSASREAYGKGTTMLIRVGPRGPAPGMSRLVEVQFRELV